MEKVINSEYIDKVYEDLKDLFLAGGLDEVLYYKGLIALAYEYICLADTSNCLHLITECDGHYINNVMPDQMEEDPKFKALVVKLVDILEKAGIAMDSLETNEETVWMNIYTKTMGKA